MVSIQNGARQTESLLLGVWGQRGTGLLLALFALRPLATCHDRTSSLDYYEIRSNSSLERYDSIGPPFHCTFKVRRGFKAPPRRDVPVPLASRAHPCPLSSQLHNLGFFPVDGVTIKLTVPVATRAGNRLLLLTQFLVDQVGEGVSPPLRMWGRSGPAVGMETPQKGSPRPSANPPPRARTCTDSLGSCPGFSLLHLLGWKCGKW